MATMYHWDLPQYLSDLGGWTNPIIVDYFEQYANLLYAEYGSKIKTWITVNEPSEYCRQGYAWGSWPPAVHLTGVGDYLCAHHTVLSHARAWHLYQDKYVATQGGRVGITLNTGFSFPEDPNDPTHLAASERNLQFSVGLFAHALHTAAGDYPAIVRQVVDENSLAEGRPWSRLPKFSPEEVEYCRGASDFIGLNYYTSRMVLPATHDDEFETPSFEKDIHNWSWTKPEWPKALSDWLYSVPEGLYELLKWMDAEYQTEIIITENGWSDAGTLEDDDRITYLDVNNYL